MTVSLKFQLVVILQIISLVRRLTGQGTNGIVITPPSSVLSTSAISVTINPQPDTKLPVLFTNSSFIVFNGTKAELLLTCSSQNPVVWDFRFHRYKPNKFESFAFTSRHRFANFSDQNSHRYSADLKFTSVTTSLPKATAFTCREVGGPGLVTVTSHKIKNNAQNAKLFKVDPLAEPVGPPTPEAPARKCETRYFIQQLGPTKYKWNCGNSTELSVPFYGKTWPCKSFIDCSNTFFGPPVVESDCITYLRPDEDCPGSCTLAVTETPAVLQCRSYGPILPFIYSIKPKNALPSLVFHWTTSLAELQDMIDFALIPSKIYFGETFLLVCEISMLYFSEGTKFALKYKYETQLRILNGEESLYRTDRNYWKYSLELKADGYLDGIESVYCLAPVWNTTEWANVSYGLTFETGTKMGCPVSSKNPFVSIIPGTVASYSIPKTLLYTTKNYTFFLNCSFSEPIQWRFNYDKFSEIRPAYFKYDISYHTTYTVADEQEKYAATLKLTFNSRPNQNSVFTCSTIQNTCLQTKVELKKYNETNSLIQVQDNPEREMHKEEYECRNMFNIKVLSDSTFMWSCTIVVSSEIDGYVSEFPCKDPLTCANFFEGSLYQERCVRFLAENENCEKCRLPSQNKFGKYYPLYLGCGLRTPEMSSYLLTFNSIKNINNTRKQYFKLSDADPTDMMQLEELPAVVYTGGTLKAQCQVSRFYFAQGAELTIRTSSQNITRNDLNSFVEPALNSVTLHLTVNLTDADVGNIFVVCLASVLGNQKLNKLAAKTFAIQPIPLNICSGVSYSKIDITLGEYKSLHCDIQGKPQPTFQWGFPHSDIFHTIDGDSLILPDISSFNEGFYKCTATNQFGSISKIFELKIKEFPDQSMTQSTILVIVLSITGVVLVMILLLGYYLRRISLKNRRSLTEEEINAFLNGVSVQNTFELHETILPVFCIPYNTDLEIRRESIRIADENILGVGEFGKVYKGTISGLEKSVAIKTNKQNIDSERFKAMLTEIKVMAHIGDHNNIVRFIGACTANIKHGEVYIAVELCEKGSLKDFLVKHRQGFVFEGNGITEYANVTNPIDYENVSFKFATTELNMWVHDIAVGMNFLEAKNVIHGDLAARNVLLTWDLVAKISDFGLSRQLANYTEYVKTSQGPLPWRWMAIEALQDMKFSVQSDVWSFGVTVWEIFTLGQIPYPGLTWSVNFVEYLEGGLRLQKPQYMDITTYEKLQGCWTKEPAKRASFKSIILYLESILNGKERKQYFIPEE